MTEDELKLVENFGKDLSDLFQREGDALAGNLNSEDCGKRMAYYACAEAVTKATTRRLLMTAPMHFELTFRIPSEARP